MAPKRKKDKKAQSRLTFEPVAQSSSPRRDGPSPAKVRFTTAAAGIASSPSRPSSSAPRSSAPRSSARSSRRAKVSQGRLDDFSGPRPPSASFMPASQGRKRVVADSSDESAAEIEHAGQDEGDIDHLPSVREIIKSTTRTHDSDSDSESDSDDAANQPNNADDGATKIAPRSSQSVSTRLQRTVIDDDDEEDDEDDEPVVISSQRKRQHPSVINLEDSDDEPLQPASSAKKRSRPAMVELDDSDSEDILASPAKKRKTSARPALESDGVPRPAATPGRLRRPLQSSSPVKKSAHKGHRSDKQKNMELLRRRRAGEKITQLTSSESESEGDGERRGIYDTDSEDELQVLKEFDDDEDDPEPEEKPADRRKKDKTRKKRSDAGEDENEDNEQNLEDFVTDDEDAPLGAPLHLDIPLQFTSHASAPLKEQFPYVIEWLVHNRINPAFPERNDVVYTNAWRKLGDEVSGLASSKFASAAWKVEFYRSLKARPKLEAFEMGRGDPSRLYNNCEACGRSGHPATWMIKFEGNPYHKDTLVEVESDDSDSELDDAASVDTQGNELPRTSKEWAVGIVCCSNAETAHSLIHWKHALKEWVEERLEDEGYMTAAKLKQRDRMKPKHRRALANEIVKAWEEQGNVKALYKDFRSTLEDARNKTTTGRGLRGTKYAR
ncbi:hypothetical protein GGR56DRAFT_273999 [Xylariaceae sp. FL0804]|nr:hypothetical protein GGR56DRAFT_273999 [Xylariaceae sp. FL0804]